MKIELTQVNIDRFWKTVNKKGKSDCWEWSGTIGNRGYGVFRIKRNKKHIVMSVHRLAFTLVNGEISAGLLVLHKCDNPICANPSHLFLGTHADNSNDKMLKGRARPHIGETHPQAKLTDAKVRQIRQMRSEGKTIEEIARVIGVGYGHTARVLRGEVWTHVK